MNETYLIESAKKLDKVSISSYQEYASKMDILLERINSRMLSRPDIIELVGEKNLDMMKDNHSNHIRFISSILKYYNPEILVDTVIWVFRAYRNRGFSEHYWSAQLNSWLIILKEVLSENSYHEIYPYYEWIQVNIPSFVKLSDMPNNL